MLTLLLGMRDVIFPVRDGQRFTSTQYLTLLLILPVLGCGVWIWGAVRYDWALRDPGVIAGCFGVLGGLLIAQAIFVFQLRLAYDTARARTAKKGPPQGDTRVRPRIDETFTGVLYSSFVSLLLTFFCAFLSATLPAADMVPTAVSAAIVFVAVHLLGCLIHVIKSTVASYQSLTEPSGA